MNIKELEKIIGADSLEYITVDDLVQAIGLPVTNSVPHVLRRIYGRRNSG